MSSNASFNIDAEHFNVARFLRSKSAAVKTFEGVMAERRVQVFKGTAAIKALQSPAYRKLAKAPPVETREEAQKVLQELMDGGLFVRAKSINNTKFLQPDLARSWGDEALYVWVYEGSQLWNLLGALGLVLVAVALLMYPMWPYKLRLGTWYLMMAGAGLIGLLFVIAIVRVVVFALTVYTVPPGIWLFPNLWEDCSVIDSFFPLWDWHPNCRSHSAAKVEKPSEKPLERSVGKSAEKISTSISK